MLTAYNVILCLKLAVLAVTLLFTSQALVAQQNPADFSWKKSPWRRAKVLSRFCRCVACALDGKVEALSNRDSDSQELRLTQKTKAASRRPMIVLIDS